MFEINLVPDVKEQLLKKQRLRNLIIFISIVVAAGSGGVVMLLGSVVVGQNIARAGKDEEIQCRSEGPGGNVTSCKKDYGTPVLKFENLNDYLTIQDQMSKISALNDGRLLLSRIFGLMDVILPVGDDRVDVSELTINMQNSMISFDAQGDSVSNIDYRSLLVFKDLVRLSYYDYGRYMRYDKEAESFVEIPTGCIKEIVDEGTGLIRGIYSKGIPGCEAPLLSPESQMNVPEVIPTEDEEMDEKEEAQIVEVEIKRVYRTQEEKENYQEEENEVDGERYYFESECIIYGENGRFDEGATRANCQLSETAPMIRDSSNGRDSDGKLVLRFSAAVIVNRELFRFANKHMRVVGPMRQNVTDSYTQIRNMFKERATACAPDDEECQQEVLYGD